MRRLLFFFLKLFLLLLLIAIVVVGALIWCKYKGWPWWIGIAIANGLFSVILLLYFLKRWLFRRREAKFVKRIIEQDESAIMAAPAEERAALRDLQERWKEGVAVLRRSKLRRFGNPLYALPWYLVMGEPGSGKTSAIKSAGLQSPVTDVSPISGISGTRNCDWWFFENAVILDTAGRYAVPVNPGRDKEEWKQFLTLMVKYRKKEPLNGVVVTIAADKLMDADAEVLAQEGRQIRMRLDELMRSLGSRIPIYILVTKMDLVSGMVEFADMLPEGALEQAMGATQPRDGGNPLRAMEEAVEDVGLRLKALRFLLIEQHGSVEPEFLLFLDEFAKLGPKLRAFTAGALEDNVYQATPHFRGLYFSSAQQRGRTKSRLLGQTLTFKDSERELPGTDKGLFLRDLFALILPGDRRLHRPLKEYIRWRRITHIVGLVAWIGIFACLMGLFSHAYLKNKRALDQVRDDFSRLPAMSGELGKDLTTLHTFRRDLARMHDLNEPSLLPGFGLDHARSMEEKLKREYCALFDKGVVEPLDRLYIRRIDRFTPETSEDVMTEHIVHLVKRIDLLNARLKGDTGKDLAALDQPSLITLYTDDDADLPVAAADFPAMYLSYLDYSTDMDKLTKERNRLRSLIIRIADSRGSLNWMVHWAALQPGIVPVTLNRFWGGANVTGFNEAKVNGAFTVAGKKRIDELLDRIQETLDSPESFAKRRTEFETWYRGEYIAAWRQFCVRFDEGRMRLNTTEEWRNLAQNMGNLNNPYYKFLDAMADELQPVIPATEDPLPWIKLAFWFRLIKANAAQDEDAQQKKSASILTEAAQAGKSLFESGDGGAAAPQSLADFKNIKKASERFREFLDALSQVVPGTASPGMSFKMLSEFFAQDPGAAGGSPVYTADAALVKAKSILSTGGKDEDIFWDLFSGPLYFLLDYAIFESACELQSRWESDVLAEVREMPEAKLRAALFDKDQGLVWAFTDGPAKPFLKHGTNGYEPRQSLNVDVPFDEEFLQFLNKGSSQTQMLLPEYQIKIKALPTNTNAEARIKPYSTLLEVECGEEKTVLENLNYPANQTFVWKPDTCGDVTFTIGLEYMKLIKRYEGVNGFPKFLTDFRDGVRTFTPEDFPARAKDLADLGITEIMVHYEFSREYEQLLHLLSKESTFLPKKAVTCWHE